MRRRGGFGVVEEDRDGLKVGFAEVGGFVEDLGGGRAGGWVGVWLKRENRKGGDEQAKNRVKREEEEDETNPVNVETGKMEEHLGTTTASQRRRGEEGGGE